MWWIIVIAVLLLPLIYLLFAPFFIEIDTTTGLCRLRYHRLASASLCIKDDSLYLLVNIAWWRTEYDLLKPRQPQVKVEEKKAVKKPGRRKGGKMVKRIWKVVQSFRFNKCYITFDTGSMPANGILYPWFYLLSWKTGKTIMVNFWDENEVVLEVENSVARMAWAYITA